MAKQKTYGLPTLMPVNYDRRTGEYNDPLKGVGYDASSGDYYDAFAEDGGEYVNPQQYKKKYGLRALAQGGYVQEGEPVIVGDGGQPELFVPDQSGYVYPQVPQQQQQKPLNRMTMEEARAAGYLPPPTSTSQIAGSTGESAERVYGNFRQMRPTEQLRYRDSNRMTWRYDDEKGPGYDNPVTGFVPESQPQQPSYQGQQAYRGQQSGGGSPPQYQQQQQRPQGQQPIAPMYDDRSGFTPGYQPPGSRSSDSGGMVSGRMINGKFQRDGNSPGSSYFGGGTITQADALEGYAGLNNAYKAKNLGNAPGPDGRPSVDPHYPMEGPYGFKAMMALDPDPNRPLQVKDEQGNWITVRGADKYIHMSEQMRVNRKAQGMRGVNPGDPDYGSRYYSVQADNPEAVRSMPVPQNYAAPLGVTNQPNDPGMRALEQSRQQTGAAPKTSPDQYPYVPMQTGQSRGRGVGLSALQQSQSGFDNPVLRGPVTGETDDLVQRGSTAGGFDNPVQRGPATGLSSMQQQGQQSQQTYTPTQVQTAQSLMDTIQNGTPRQSILAAAKAGGYGDAELVQGQDGSMQLVTRGSGPVYSGGQVVDEGTQPKRIASFRPGQEGLRDVADFLHTVLTPQQQKANEGLVKYTGEQANRQEDKSFDREKLAMSEGMKTDTYNRGLAAMYAKELDAAQKAHAANLMNSDKPFDKEAFDKSFDAGLSRFGVTPKTGQVGLGQMPPQGQPGNEAVTPEYQDLYNLQQGGGDRLRSLVGRATPQPTPMQTREQPTTQQVQPQATLPPQAAARLKEGAVVRFGNGQSWTLQNGQPVQVQAQQTPLPQEAPRGSNSFRGVVSPPAPQGSNSFRGVVSPPAPQGSNSFRGVVNPPASQEAPQVGLGQSGSISAPQYQGQYRRMMDYINSGKQMDMAPQPAIPYSGGHWGDNSFTPSRTNQVMMSPKARERYFQQVEPNAELLENVGGRMMNVNTNNNGGNGLFTQAGLGQPMPMQPQAPTSGERASQAVSSVVNPQRGNEPSPDWQEVAALPEKLEAQYPGIVKYLTAISQAQRLPFNAVLGVLTKGGEGAAKLWQGFQRARQTGLAY